MKLLVDLFACQTGSRFRGIGRYTLSLIREMIRLRGSHEIIALANQLYPDSFEELRQEFIRLLPAGSFLPYSHQALNVHEGEKDPYFEIASTLVRHAYQVISPDVTLYPSVFEGWGEQSIVPLPNTSFPSSLRVAIVYDFIPYRFTNWFLETDLYFKNYYLRRLDSLKSFDLLLAISESTRKDAIEILNTRSDQVVSISAAASPIFKKIDYTKDETDIIFSRFGISQPYIFYAGNVEPHKNVEKALRAFAQLPKEVRDSHQFVLKLPGDEKAFRNKIRSIGLGDNELVIIGYISDEELVALYNLCKLFIFPSLYEGFGLPILEAMACGAPVIASNNSSIPEVIDREDALFDASDEEAITATLFHALSDDGFRKELSSYGLERARRFSWENTALRAWQAIENALKGYQSKRVGITMSNPKSKMQIAYVSPLPPQKSGIANYSAELLPHLSRHFKIDLFVEPGLKVKDPFIKNNFNLYPFTKLLERRDHYETVVYQVGNSEFHAHMLRLLREYPGIVVLHDFFLSHLIEYTHSTRNLKNPQEDFLYEVGCNHGLSSMIEFCQRGFDTAIWDWPLNWQVLKYAQELIVHSNYHNSLIERYYGYGWYPKPSVIKQSRCIIRDLSPSSKLNARKELGIDQNKFVFCSFGFVNATKLNLLTIRAFFDYLAIDKNALLIFVGDLDKGKYGQQILEVISELGLKEQVRITGFVDDDTYQKYLKAVDVAIQLRKQSRGETSRAVLDCMANGIPTIINAHGSLDDYIPEVVVKIPEFPTLDHLAQAMIHLRQDEDFREKLVQRAHKEIVENHNPEYAAAAYAEVIRRAAQTSEGKLFSPLVDALFQSNSRDEWLKSSTKYAAKNMSLRSQPRILIDVTNISYIDLRTGIQRVVKNLIRELFNLKNHSVHFELIKINDGRLFRASRFAERLFNLTEGSLGAEIPISVQPGDTLFMLDTSWNLYDQFIPIFDQIRKAGGRIITMVYDLIPIKYPDVSTKETVYYFKIWINMAITQSDGLACISQAVADDLEAYIYENYNLISHRLDLSYIHLGADISVTPQESNIRDGVRSLIDASGFPLFLMVGTIEPRKGYGFALDAFERLWKRGYDYHLCIVGKVGWNVEDIERRLRYHPELGKCLYFVENASDAEINLCYSISTALVIPSIAEGFGLPIVEAALHEVPALASDIPVFREVGGEGTIYFSLESPSCLADAVHEMVLRKPKERIALAKKVRIMTWRESAEWMFDILKSKRVYRTLQPMRLQ